MNRALLSAVGTVLLLPGCSAIVGDYPFSSLPAAKLGKPAKFSPGSALYTSLSTPPQVYATETVRDAEGRSVTVRNVTLFVQVTSPRGPWEGCQIAVAHDTGKRWLFPVSAAHSWSIEGPFGIGRHTLTVEVVVDGVTVHTRDVSFTVYPLPGGSL